MVSSNRSLEKVFVLLGGILNFVGLGYYYTVASFIPAITIYLMKHDSGTKYINPNWFPILILLTSAVVMPLAGVLERRTIFKVPLLLSAMFCSIGILLSHLSVNWGYALFALTHCVMYGIGFGLNYPITPSVVLKWYPNNQCLACGSVFFGLGVGSILFSQIQSLVVKPQKCDFNSANVSNCEASNKVPSVFMINGSVIFTVQMLGTLLMSRKQINEYGHEEEGTNEAFSQQTEDSETLDVKPRDLIRYKGFFILWLLHLIECFPTSTFRLVYKLIGSTTVKSQRFVHVISESSAVFFLIGFILWSFLADKISFKIPLLIVTLTWTIGLSVAPLCLQLQPIKFFYASLVFLSTLCIAGYRILLLVTTAKAFGVKYLSFNFACINTASIFGGVFCALFMVYFPVAQRIDLVLYLCASLNAAALLLGLSLPDEKNGYGCCKLKSLTLEESVEMESTKSFTKEQ